MNIEQVSLALLQAKASHNSESRLEDLAGQLDFSPTTPWQGGCRSIELDVHQKKDEWTWSVNHIGGYRQDSSLASWLRDFSAWLDANPDHEPVFLYLDLKNAPMDDATFADEIDARLRKYLSTDRLYSPGELMGDAGDLVSGARKNGWPSLGALRGRVIPVFTGNDAGAVGDRRAFYCGHAPRDRVFFVDRDCGTGQAPWPDRDKGDRVVLNVHLWSLRREWEAFAREFAGDTAFITRGWVANGSALWERATASGLNLVATDKICNHPWAHVGNAPYAALARKRAPRPKAGTLSLLTYNTHIAEGSNFGTGAKIFGEDVFFDDAERFGHIISRVRESGADLVALQEVWAEKWQQRAVERLRDVYPYGISPRTHKLDPRATSGLVLLSRHRLTDVGFARYQPSEVEEAMATKGVLTVTAHIPAGDGRTHAVRVGITHMLTGQQLSGPRLLCSQTVQNGLPAIMMGDFNFHRSQYGELNAVMDAAGASDVGYDCHGEQVWDASMTTVDRCANRLDQVLSKDALLLDCESEGRADRIDYAYVRPGDGGIVLGPRSYTVHRDWTYQTKRAPWVGNKTIESTSAGIEADASRSNYTPAAVVRNGQPELVYKHPHNNTLFIAALGSDGRLEPRLIPKCTSPQTPGIAVEGSTLHMVYRGTSKTKLHYMTHSGGRWRARGAIDGMESNYGPALAVHGESLYMVYKEAHGNALYWARAENGKFVGRQKVGADSNYTPALAEYDGDLYMVRKEPHGNDLFLHRLDGSKWSGLGRIEMKVGGDTIVSRSNYTPGLAALKGRLFMLYKGAHSNDLYEATFDGSAWEGNVEAGSFSSCNPASNHCPRLVTYDGRLLAFYKGAHSNDLYIASKWGRGTKMPLSDHYPVAAVLDVMDRRA